MSESSPFRPGGEGAILALGSARSGALAIGVTGALGALVVPSFAAEALVVAVAALVSAIRIGELAPAEWVSTAVAFYARSRWTRVSVNGDGRRCTLRARGRREMSLRELRHRGRLDLSGEDDDVLNELIGVIDATANGSEPAHVSWHRFDDATSSSVVLATPVGVATSSRWVEMDVRGLRDRFAPARGARDGWLYEKWSYLRSRDELICVFALRSSLAPPGTNVLTRLCVPTVSREVAVQVRVRPSSRASTLAGRQTHRWRANVTLASVSGFRRRASFDASSDEFVRREREVAAGRALAEVVIFVVVRAQSRSALEVAVDELRRDATRAGATLSRANGRQATWFCAQLPGSPAWGAR